MIEPGSPMPSVKVKCVDKLGTSDVDTADLVAKGRTVMFSLPGAFTPTCHNDHLPGYIELADKIRAAGADRIICATVNDHHVVTAWAKATEALGKLEFIADGNADLAKALGLEKDMSGGGMGVRFIRAAIVVHNGEIKAVFAEDRPGQVTSSGAPAVLEALAGL